MDSKKITKKKWQRYFDDFSLTYLKDDQPEYIEIQLVSKDMGVQPQTGWTVLEGISYDPKSDVLVIQVDKMEHMIAHPHQIFVNEEDNGWITGMMVVQKNGEQNIIDIR
jgi:uncharacterized protein YuzE